jgi:hypothetical protein
VCSRYGALSRGQGKELGVGGEARDSPCWKTGAADGLRQSRIRGLGDEVRKADRHAGGLDVLPAPFVVVFPLHRGREVTVLILTASKFGGLPCQNLGQRWQDNQNESI